jgi:hypothetical protein
MLVIAREKLIIAGNYVYIVIFYFIVYTKAIKEDRPHAQIMAYQWGPSKNTGHGYRE